MAFFLRCQMSHCCAFPQPVRMFKVVGGLKVRRCDEKQWGWGKAKGPYHQVTC